MNIVLRENPRMLTSRCVTDPEEEKGRCDNFKVLSPRLKRRKDSN